MPIEPSESLTTCDVYFNIPDFLLCRVLGHDRERYLQGRITQDVKNLKPSQHSGCLLLSPQGKIQSRFDIIQADDHYLAIIEAMDSATFSESLLQFAVADDVTLDFIQDRFCLFSVQGPNAATILSSLGLNDYDAESSMAQVIPSPPFDISVYPKKRSLNGGFDLLVAKADQADLETALRNSSATHLDKLEDVQALRISAGIPQFGAEMGTDVMATEIPFQDLISFNKGCYAGQEAVEMSIARGRPNRTLMKLRSDSKAELSESSEIYSNSKLELRVGKVTSQAPKHGLYLALVKTKHSELDQFWAGDVKLQRED
jgi:folate-binding protein YgfZ